MVASAAGSMPSRACSSALGRPMPSHDAPPETGAAAIAIDRRNDRRSSAIPRRSSATNFWAQLLRPRCRIVDHAAIGVVETGRFCRPDRRAVCGLGRLQCNVPAAARSPSIRIGSPPGRRFSGNTRRSASMRQTPTIRNAHCREHETHRGACAGCQRASLAAAREQLALVTPQTRRDLGAFLARSPQARQSRWAA